MQSFDIKDCIYLGERIFAWDSRTKSVIEIDVKSVPTKDVPEGALNALLTAIANRRERTNG